MVVRLIAFIPPWLKAVIGGLLLALAVSVGSGVRTRRRLQRAEAQASTDSLTGLPNRAWADEILERLIAGAMRKRQPLGVVLCDLDHFKQINDRFGHGTGDAALRAAAKALRRGLRTGDHVARFGGEEFLVVLPHAEVDDVKIVAEKLRQALMDTTVEGLDRRLTGSFGAAVFPEAGISTDELLTAADVALYRAKENGRNRVEVEIHEDELVLLDDVPDAAACGEPTVSIAAAGAHPS